MNKTNLSSVTSNQYPISQAAAVQSSRVTIGSETEQRAKAAIGIESELPSNTQALFKEVALSFPQTNSEVTMVDSLPEIVVTDEPHELRHLHIGPIPGDILLTLPEELSNLRLLHIGTLLPSI